MVTTRSQRRSSAPPSSVASDSSVAPPEVDLSMPPEPRVAPITIIELGVFLFAVAHVYPPLILVVTAILACLLPYLYRENDDGETRRRLWAEFMRKDGLPEELYCRDVQMEETYWVNDRGMALLTSTMVPKRGKPKAVICFCHGYMDNSSFLKRIYYQALVKKGIAVAMIEYEGHGRSDGPNTLIPCWDTLLGDVQKFFTHVGETKFPGTKKFLLGESMGGAVAYDLISRHREHYEGVIFVAPMCRISVVPPKIVVDAFEMVVGDPGTVNALTGLPLAPAKDDISALSFKDKEKMRLALAAPTRYGRKPRLATARELMNTTRRIQPSINAFDAPFLVLHGLDDKVTCPKISEMLYAESPSKDKDIRLYKGMYHNLTAGETDENIQIVFNDVISWVMKRI